MKYAVLKIMEMGQGNNNYRVLGHYKTHNGALNKAKKAAILYPQKNVIFKIVEL